MKVTRKIPKLSDTLLTTGFKPYSDSNVKRKQYSQKVICTTHKMKKVNVFAIYMCINIHSCVNSFPVHNYKHVYLPFQLSWATDFVMLRGEVNGNHKQAASFIY